MDTPNDSRKTPRRQQRGGVGLSRSVLLSVFASNQGGHDIQGGGGRHPALLPALDGAPRYSAEIRQRLSGQPALVADRLDAWSVVHKRPVIREDDGLPVGRRTVVGRHSHGSVLGEGEAASEVDQVVADAVNLDDGDGLAIAGLGLAEVLLDGAHGGLAIGADRSGVAGEAVADGGLGLGGGHCLGGWSLASLPLTRTIYAIVRKSQQLFAYFFFGRFLVHSTHKLMDADLDNLTRDC
jgi:hypothetical protein